MISKAEYNKVVDIFLNDSPYCRREKREKMDIIIDFLGDFFREHSFLIENNKVYKIKNFQN